MRQQVARIDKDQPIRDVAILEELQAKSLTTRRVNLLLFGAFSLLGLLLASAGIYGVVAYAASQRRHEMGIRMALGAGRSDLVRLVVSQGLGPALIGIGIGMVASLALTRFLRSMLFGVKPTDPVTFVWVSLILAAIALLASYIPARRATKVDPMVALRYE
ncbi:MAG: FtsX-like permease family protein [Terriglobia bacterium]